MASFNRRQKKAITLGKNVVLVKTANDSDFVYILESLNAEGYSLLSFSLTAVSTGVTIQGAMMERY